MGLLGQRWDGWMAKFCRPFTKAEIRYYDRSQADQARAWIHESLQDKAD